MKTKKTYKGEGEATLLVGRMNDGPAAQRSALVEIVCSLQRLQQSLPITRRGMWAGDPTLRAQLEERARLNRILRAYEAVPFIDPPRQKGAGIRLKWHRTGDSAIRRRQTRGDADLELFVVLMAVQLAEVGMIHKVQLCEKCQSKWFFGRTRRSRWCSDKCSYLFYRDDPEKKKERNENAKKYYADHLSSRRTRRSTRKKSGSETRRRPS